MNSTSTALTLCLVTGSRRPEFASVTFATDINATMNSVPPMAPKPKSAPSCARPFGCGCRDAAPGTYCYHCRELLSAIPADSRL